MVVTSARHGPRFVLGLYALLVAFAGVAGAAVAAVVEGVQRPVLFLLVPLPPTPLGFAVYGAITVAVVLGIPLAGVVYVSRRIDGADAVDAGDPDRPRE